MESHTDSVSENSSVVYPEPPSHNFESSHSTQIEEHEQRDLVEIPDRVFFRIGDVSEIVGVKPYVLRYWESEFPVISPEKSNTGQRVYRRADVETLLLIKHLLYTERYSIEGARKRIRQLRKEGEFTTYKKQNVLGGEENIARQERMKKIHKKAIELRTLLKFPIREIFKF